MTTIGARIKHGNAPFLWQNLAPYKNHVFCHWLNRNYPFEKKRERVFLKNEGALSSWTHGSPEGQSWFAKKMWPREKMKKRGREKKMTFWIGDFSENLFKRTVLLGSSRISSVFFDKCHVFKGNLFFVCRAFVCFSVFRKQHPHMLVPVPGFKSRVLHTCPMAFLQARSNL